MRYPRVANPLSNSSRRDARACSVSPLVVTVDGVGQGQGVVTDAGDVGRSVGAGPGVGERPLANGSHLVDGSTGEQREVGFEAGQHDGLVARCAGQRGCRLRLADCRGEVAGRRSHHAERPLDDELVLRVDPTIEQGPGDGPGLVDPTAHGQRLELRGLHAGPAGPPFSGDGERLLEQGDRAGVVEGQGLRTRPHEPPHGDEVPGPGAELHLTSDLDGRGAGRGEGPAGGGVEVDADRREDVVVDGVPDQVVAERQRVGLAREHGGVDNRSQVRRHVDHTATRDRRQIRQRERPSEQAGQPQHLHRALRECRQPTEHGGRREAGSAGSSTSARPPRTPISPLSSRARINSVT